MQIGPFTLARTKALPLQGLRPLSSGGNGWWPIIRESFTGAWQQNVTISASSALTYSAVFACVTLIASDIAKLGLRLVALDDDGIWTETDSPSFSPVLRKPNRYQTRIKFIEQWITSKLIHGNTYVLKQRDNRKVVTELYVLDPTRVTPLVAADGSVYYQISRDDLSGLPEDSITVPASEIIHDLMVALYHPLIGVSPIYACGVAAMQGLSIQTNSQKFFANGSSPGGVLTAPGAISDETAARLKAHWDAAYTGDNVGKVAVLGDALHFEKMAVNAVDAQLIEQLKWTADTVCSCFHIQPYMISVGPPPPYANIEPLNIQYFCQCLQEKIESLELSLDEGIGLGPQFGNRYGTEFDLSDLLRMDSATQTTVLAAQITAGLLKPDEGRKALGRKPVPGGDTPYMQQQMYSLAALAKRDADDPFAKPTPAALQPAPDEQEEDDEDDEQMAASFTDLLRKELELAA